MTARFAANMRGHHGVRWVGPAAARVSLGSVLALAFAAIACAQPPTPGQQSAIKSACRGDYQAVCANVKPGGPEALQCLQENASHVSPACRSALSAVEGVTTAPPTEGGSAAPPPASTAAMPSGTGPSSMPMRGGSSSMPMRQEMKLTRQACGRDYRKFCQGVQAGGGHAITCLEANAPSLSPVCRQALAAIKSGAGK